MNVAVAARLMDFDDTRSFTMREAADVSTNLFLAPELLELIKKER